MQQTKPIGGEAFGNKSIVKISFGKTILTPGIATIVLFFHSYNTKDTQIQR